MNGIEIPYMPISEFDASKVSEKFLDTQTQNEEDLNEYKLKLNLTGYDLPEEVIILLIGMKMEKYVELFEEINIDLDTFLNLTESDLQEIGITDPDDRRIICENVKFLEGNKQDFRVHENHVEDLQIIKNIHQQLSLLQKYCCYVEVQMKKHTFTDYVIDSQDTACTFFKVFANSALTQSDIISKRIYDADDSEALTNKLLKIYNLTLPKSLEESLPKRKKRERKYFMKVMVLIGFTSFVVLTGSYLMRKR